MWTGSHLQLFAASQQLYHRSISFHSTLEKKLGKLGIEPSFYFTLTLFPR
jgi:hypothetical protein